jgi:hypothetical protein
MKLVAGILAAVAFTAAAFILAKSLKMHSKAS